MAVIPRPSSSATQTRSPPKTSGPGWPPTSIRCLDPPVSPSIRSTSPFAGSAHPDRFGADRDPGDPAPEVQPGLRPGPLCRRRSGTGCRRGRSSPRPSARRWRSAAARGPTAIGEETEDVVAAEELLGDEGDRDHRQHGAHGDRRPPGVPRPAGSDCAPPPRPPSTAVRSPGTSESTRVAAGVAPWRSRASSISAVAVG